MVAYLFQSYVNTLEKANQVSRFGWIFRMEDMEHTCVLIEVLLEALSETLCSTSVQTLLTLQMPILSVCSSATGWHKTVMSAVCKISQDVEKAQVVALYSKAHYCWPSVECGSCIYTCQTCCMYYDKPQSKIRRRVFNDPLNGLFLRSQGYCGLIKGAVVVLFFPNNIIISPTLSQIYLLSRLSSLYHFIILPSQTPSISPSVPPVSYHPTNYLFSRLSSLCHFNILPYQTSTPTPTPTHKHYPSSVQQSHLHHEHGERLLPKKSLFGTT